MGLPLLVLSPRRFRSIAPRLPYHNILRSMIQEWMVVRTEPLLQERNVMKRQKARSHETYEVLLRNLRKSFMTTSFLTRNE